MWRLMDDRDLYAGPIRLHVLYYASRERVYGKAMIEQLAGHGYKASSGSLLTLTDIFLLGPLLALAALPYW